MHHLYKHDNTKKQKQKSRTGLFKNYFVFLKEKNDI